MPIAVPSMAGAQGRILHAPSAFGYLPGAIIKPTPTTYAPSFTYEQNATHAGQTYYLSPTGSGTNSGLTPAAPLQTFAQAFAKTDLGEMVLENGATFDRTMVTYVNQNLSRDLVIRVASGGNAYLLGSDQNILWSVNGTFGNVYQYVRNNVNSVCDASIPNANSLWTKYSKQTSVANVSSTAGSWYSDGINVYVRTLDGRPPDNDIQVMLGISSVFKPTVNVKISMQGLKFWGPQTVGARAFSSTVYPTVWAKDCDFYYTETTTNGWQGLGADRLFFGCNAKQNLADGFNDHFSGRIGNAFEYQCNGSFNGDVTSAVNDNGSTMHDGGKIVRMSCYYEGNYGPNMADVSSNTYSLAIGCNTLNSLKAASPNNITSGGDSFGGTKVYLINHLSSQSGGASGFKDVVTGSPGTVRYLPGTGTATLTLNGTPGSLVKCASEQELFSV